MSAMYKKWKGHPEKDKCLEPTNFRSFNFVLKFKFQIQWLFSPGSRICPPNRANHDWGSLSGAMDDTHKSQKCTCITAGILVWKTGTGFVVVKMGK